MCVSRVGFVSLGACMYALYLVGVWLPEVPVVDLS